MDDRTRSKFSFREIMGNMTEEQEISHAKWIQENQPYFAIALPTTSVKDSVGKYGATTYMSFTILKKYLTHQLNLSGHFWAIGNELRGSL